MSDQQQYKIALEKTLAEVTTELEGIAQFNADTNDWVIKTTDLDQTEADLNNQADATEEADERISILSELENRYRLTKHALIKIAQGTYGTCEISGEPIEPERLAVNPAARTCIDHREQEYELPLP